MSTIAFARLMVTAALFVSPIAASAQNNPNVTTKLAENTTAASPSTQAPKPAPATAVPEKKICKLLPSSYSHLSKRACLTEKEWKQLEDEQE